MVADLRIAFLLLMSGQLLIYRLVLLMLTGKENLYVTKLFLLLCEKVMILKDSVYYLLRANTLLR